MAERWRRRLTGSLSRYWKRSPTSTAVAAASTPRWRSNPPSEGAGAPGRAMAAGAGAGRAPPRSDRRARSMGSCSRSAVSALSSAKLPLVGLGPHARRHLGLDDRTPGVERLVEVHGVGDGLAGDQGRLHASQSMSVVFSTMAQPWRKSLPSGSTTSR